MIPPETDSTPTGNGLRRDILPIALALMVIIALLLAPPHHMLDKADHAAFAVCHRLPERSFEFAGRPLPLCARCSGLYLSALAGLIVLLARGRGRASGLPGGRHMAVFGLFLAAWAIDGANSFLTFFPGAPRLYEPFNLLRLITGALAGLALAAVTLPMLNLSLWAAPKTARAVSSWSDLGWMLAAAGAVIAAVSSEWAPLLYPLALISGGAVVVMLGLVNTMLVTILLRREGQAARPRQVVAPLLLGLALALIEITSIGLARTALETHLGLPF